MTLMIYRCFAALLVCFSLATPALSHSKMSGSNPASGTSVGVGIDSIELVFDRAVRLTRVDLVQAPDQMDLEMMMAMMTNGEMQDLEGQIEVEIASKLPRGFVDSTRVNFEGLEHGIYMLHWIAIAQDGHTMKGDVHFAVVTPE
ncbi:MAG: hypothetical protein CMF26_02960 [Kiloniella sp.]|nr:hypothetical protein [Kiloniella sp.]